MADGVRVDGIPEATRAYQGIADDAHDLTPAHRVILDRGIAAAEARAPRRTGSLAASITGEAKPREADLEIGVPYWPFTEYGTRYIRARRYMAAGAAAMEAAAPDAYAAQLSGIIDRRTQ